MTLSREGCVCTPESALLGIADLPCCGQDWPGMLASASHSARGIEAVRQDRATHDLPPGDPRAACLARAVVFGTPDAVLMDLPQLTEDQPAHHPLIAAQAVPWPGEMAVFRKAGVIQGCAKNGKGWHDLRSVLPMHSQPCREIVTPEFVRGDVVVNTRRTVFMERPKNRQLPTRRAGASVSVEGVGGQP